MASVYDDIRNALETQLAGITGIPDIAWENVNYTPTTGSTYVQPTFIPLIREPAVRGLNPQQYYAGMFRIDVMTPEGKGPGAGATLTNTLVESFEATSTLTANSVNVCIRSARVEMSISVDAWFMTPVIIDWYTYQT